MTPWDLAKAGTEHAHQRALFAWANCAALYGFNAADDERAYKFVDREQIPQNVKLGWNARPELSLLFAIHNQGHGDAIRGGRAKAEGVKAGVPDVMLPVVRIAPNGALDGFGAGGYRYYAGLFIELKRPKSEGKAKGVESHDQSDFAAKLSAQGYHCVVSVGWERARDDVKDYLK